MTHKLYLSLGSNLGDREANIRQALALIDERVGSVYRVSSCIETAPVGFSSPNKFINVVCLVHTMMSPMACLRETQKIEKELGRTQKSINPDGSLTVDLHIEAIPGGISVPKGQQLQFQMDTFRRIIRQNANRRGMKITFIHGIGDGILKAAIRKELDEVLALRCSYSVGDPAVTTVYIK